MNKLAEPTLALNTPYEDAARRTGLRAALRAWWARRRMDPRTAYLSQATSHADLECRMRQWEYLQRDESRWLF